MLMIVLNTMVYFQSNDRDFDFKKPYIEGVVGSGKHRKIILKSQLFPDTKYRSVE